MKMINRIHLITSFALSIFIASYFGIIQSVSFLLGSAVILGNINIFGLLLGGENKQISVAWSTFIIVSKYAVLIALVYFLISSESLSAAFVAAGFVSLLISIVIYALIINFKKVNHGTL